MTSIRVLLVDDHNLVRAGIRMLLEKIEGIEVVGEVREGTAVLEAVRKTHPHIVLMDIAMPGMNGMETTARLKKKYPGVGIVILSMYANDGYLQQSLRAGAAGYLLKDAERSELEFAIRTVLRGGTYLTPTVARLAATAVVSQAKTEAGPLQKLTPRQRETLQLIAEGHTTKDIAQRLNIGVRTVETHRAELMERLDIHDIAGLVRLAVKEGLVKLNP